MNSILLVLHIVITLALIGTVLLQRSEGGGLGIGGSSSGGGFMTARGTASFLTRLTAILATCFFVSSITLAILASSKIKKSSIVDDVINSSQPLKEKDNSPSVPIGN
tara:strand:- start:292 stop:612 length:321 start_codon:yes stop_codon:yes gene_type:complete